MSNSEAGCAGFAIIAVHMVSAIGSGVMAWNWVKPESFGQAILFLLAWGLLWYVAQLVLMLIVAGIVGLDK